MVSAVSTSWAKGTQTVICDPSQITVSAHGTTEFQVFPRTKVTLVAYQASQGYINLCEQSSVGPWFTRHAVSLREFLIHRTSWAYLSVTFTQAIVTPFAYFARLKVCMEGSFSVISYNISSRGAATAYGSRAITIPSHRADRTRNLR